MEYVRSVCIEANVTVAMGQEHPLLRLEFPLPNEPKQHDAALERFRAIDGNAIREIFGLCEHCTEVLNYRVFLLVRETTESVEGETLSKMVAITDITE